MNKFDQLSDELATAWVNRGKNFELQILGQIEGWLKQQDVDSLEVMKFMLFPKLVQNGLSFFIFLQKSIGSQENRQKFYNQVQDTTDEIAMAVLDLAKAHELNINTSILKGIRSASSIEACCYAVLEDFDDDFMPVIENGLKEYEEFLSEPSFDSVAEDGTNLRLEEHFADLTLSFLGARLIAFAFFLLQDAFSRHENFTEELTSYGESVFQRFSSPELITKFVLQGEEEN